jgi:uncharacterized membrane protein (DUF373 family)
MRQIKYAIKTLIDKRENDAFLNLLDQVEDFIAKILCLAMVLVVLFSAFDLAIFLSRSMLLSPPDGFSLSLLTIFGLFLNILIALEIMQNIASYLGNHIIQIEMVVTTSLIAVARKIIVLDLKKISDMELFALAATILALSICYWLVRRTNAKHPRH